MSYYMHINMQNHLLGHQKKIQNQGIRIYVLIFMNVKLLVDQNGNLKIMYLKMLTYLNYILILVLYKIFTYMGLTVARLLHAKA